MLKSSLLLLLFSLSGFISQAQLMDHKFHIYGRYGMGGVQGVPYTNNLGTSYSMGSLNAEILLKKQFGLNYNFDYQIRKDSINQFHASMGVIGAPILMGFGLYKSFDGDTTSKGAGAILVGLLLLALPDGVSFHYSPAYSWDISPYANILGLDFIRDKKSNETFVKYACSFGVKSTYILNDFLTFSAFAETRQAAKFGWGFSGGLGVGVLLGKKQVSVATVE